MDVKIPVSVGYEYEGCNESIGWIHRLVKLEGHRANRFMLGGWSLSVHHHYDVVHSTFQFIFLFNIIFENYFCEINMPSRHILRIQES